MDLSIAGGLSISSAINSLAETPGVFTGLTTDISKKLASDMGNRLTNDDNTNPDRVRYFGDPTTAFVFQATSIMPSFNQRWRNSAHSYTGMEIPDLVPIHDTPKHYLTPSGKDEDATMITE